jgi:peptidoglycan/LPS O-acetylase OafA/YrhL
LVHKPVFMALHPELESRGIDATSPLTIVAVMAVGSFGGWVLYRLVETPFMRLRARWYPAVQPKSLGSAAGHPAATVPVEAASSSPRG